MTDMDLLKLYSDSRDFVYENLGEENWMLLQSATKSDLITAVFCYFTCSKNNGVDGVDFVSSIAPLMKALEKELRIAFFEPYVDYLKQNYTAEAFLQKILCERKINKYDAIGLRQKILYDSFEKAQYYSISNSTRFTLKDFSYTIGVDDCHNVRADSTFIDYCEKELQRCSGMSRSEISKWIRFLVPEVDKLREKRNNSIHAGKTQNVYDAQSAINDLISVKKIMKKLISPKE